MRSIKSIILTIIALKILTGCSHVEPWERGTLAKPHMALNPHPIQNTIRSHNYGSREASANNSGATGGGGCGCY